MEHLQIPQNVLQRLNHLKCNAASLTCLQFWHIGEILSGKKIANVVMKAIHCTPQTFSDTYIALHLDNDVN